MVDYTRTARLLLLADNAETISSVQASAELASCRVVPAPLTEAAARLDEHAGFDAIYLSVADEDGSAAELLLDRVARLAGGQPRCLVDIPPDMIDLAASKTWAPSIRHLSRASAPEQAEALAWALEREPERLHDNGRNGSRLQQLSEEVGRIASALASLSESEAQRENGQERPIDAARVRAIIRARRLRDQFLGADLFADPAWDMLLDLMAARLEGQRVPVSSLCMAAAVPPTTALRWIKVLTEQGLFVRTADPQDGRRIYIELADEVAVALDAYLRAAQRIAPITF